MGPMETRSQGGARFMVTFIDDCSRYVVSSFIRHKSEEKHRFLDFKAMVENQLNSKIKCIRTDNGGEFINNRLENICNSAGIIHKTTVPY